MAEIELGMRSPERTKSGLRSHRQRSSGYFYRTRELTRPPRIDTDPRSRVQLDIEFMGSRGSWYVYISIISINAFICLLIDRDFDNGTVWTPRTLLLPYVCHWTLTIPIGLYVMSSQCLLYSTSAARTSTCDFYWLLFYSYICSTVLTVLNNSYYVSELIMSIIFQTITFSALY
jgi:hypothetical protein